MTDYLLTCTLISLCILLTVKGLKNAPARLNFYILMTALACWFVPWQYFSQLPLFEGTNRYTFNVAQLIPDVKALIPNAEQVATKDELQSDMDIWHLLPSLSNVFMVLVLAGFGLFLLRMGLYVKLIKNLYINSKPSPELKHIKNQYPIRLTTHTEPAFATGLIKPVIWLESSMMNREELNSVIQHEVTHLQQGDIYWTWLICFIESVFWWNPICSKLTGLAREQLELSCDELCMQKLKGKYQLDLASLLLQKQSAKSSPNFFTPPLLNIAHSKSFNIQRIKMLNKEKTMKSKYLVMVAAAMSFSALAAAQIVDGTTSSKQQSSKTSQVPVKSEAYNQQLAQLLKSAAGAKSDNSELLTQAAQGIQQWHLNRDKLAGFEEAEIKLQSFRLLNHVYSKLEQYEDILSAYEKWYEPGSNPPYFLKNSLATAYIQLGRYELAVVELEDLSKQLDGKLHAGSADNLALAYIYLADYDKALKTLDQVDAKDDVYGNILKYYVYDKQNNRKKMNEIKSKIPDVFAVTPALLPQTGVPGSQLLRML
ncbi:M56 family metallopeptidase [Pseudoalteromonas carrageenovora]|uniref:M56 family metallopeptidase n=1 Tax=Pseudoalteromonas carrageenovora TaxID=227 RepID=UPI0026E4762B|nr:M56 family metallopeptidase [Pseudoalteromonas carrageenovora]MDO6546260.1 M56 family metallopeptidase [Pseudoalteromonas carrageenovora]MDO6833456.1 M56 family metallopeptidase [Pseudoalteromonas carrageenovora]MDO6835466.1 M56 family metallopeptidase [Pseudoalteromonas carrageenovora]